MTHRFSIPILIQIVTKQWLLYTILDRVKEMSITLRRESSTYLTLLAFFLVTQIFLCIFAIDNPFQLVHPSVFVRCNPQEKGNLLTPEPRETIHYCTQRDSLFSQNWICQVPLWFQTPPIESFWTANETTMLKSVYCLIHSPGWQADICCFLQLPYPTPNDAVSYLEKIVLTLLHIWSTIQNSSI